MKTNKNNNVATKEDIKELEVGTRADINRLESSTKAEINRLELSTKTDFKRLESSTKAEIQKLEGGFKRLEASTKAEIERLNQSIEQRIDARFAEHEHKMNDQFDEVIKEIRESREDRTLLSHRVYEHDTQLENHEDRIGSLEKQTATV